MKHEVKVSGIFKEFECSGPACPDTCCQGWSMQVDPKRLKAYSADPELRNATVKGPAGPIMARRKSDDGCVKFEGGLCGIQAARGSDAMPDACHFFPRIPRSIAGTVVITAALSCPETARLVLFGDAPLGLEVKEINRLPIALKTYSPEGIGPREVESVMDAILGMIDDPALSPEAAMSALGRLGRSLSLSPPTLIPSSIFPLAELVKQVKAPAILKVGDQQRVLQAAAGLVYATGNRRAKVSQIFNLMSAGLNVRLDWETLNIFGDETAEAASDRLEDAWCKWGGALDIPLKRWIKAQVLATGFPFAGPGGDVMERAWVLCLRFATLRLALMSYIRGTQGVIEPEIVVTITQILSRAMDHLDDPSLAIVLFRQMGWDNPGRLRALVGDYAEPWLQDAAPTDRPQGGLTLGSQAPGSQPEVNEQPLGS